jgi:molecular chaperone DnaK
VHVPEPAAEEFTPSPRTLDRFAAESERAKIGLSARESETLRVARLAEIDGEVYDLTESLSRTQFEFLIKDDLQDALYQVQLCLEEARVGIDDVDKVLLIGGSSEIPMLREEMWRRFATRAIPVPRTQSVIAEGAAAIAYHGYRPFLARPVQLLLSDGTPYPVFDVDTLVPITAERDLTLFCTDNRDGEARLVLAEQARMYDRSSIRQHVVLSVPVERSLPRPYNHERVYASFRINDDLILQAQAHGATKHTVVGAEIHDLRFGLRVR